MVLEIVSYGHPALRAKGRAVGEAGEEIRRLAEDMLETMTAANGVGLAAQQVGRPLQLFVLDISSAKDRPSRMLVEGRDVEPSAWMPMIFIDPEVETSGPERLREEGCLSFPGLGGKIARPDRVRVRARNLEGEIMDFEATGLLAQAIQHEYDHLQGILYIDRMAPSERSRLSDQLQDLLQKTEESLGMPALA